MGGEENEARKKKKEWLLMKERSQGWNHRKSRVGWGGLHQPSEGLHAI